MKKILSLLLLAAMLITAIPAVAAAAEETPDAGVNAVASEATPELYTLYTTRGLVALYTAFSDDGSVDLENGTWANKVAGGAAAILRDESTAGNYWQKRAMGIGYSMTLQQYDDAHATRNPGGLGDARRVGLTLPDAYYTDNFTVDAFAKVIGMTEEDGSVTVRSNEGDLYVDKASAFRFGLFSGFAFAALRGDLVSGDKVYDYYKRPTGLQENSWGWGYSSSLGIRWFMQNVGFKNGSATAPAYQVAQENGFLMARGHHSDATTDQAIPVATVLHMEKTTEEGADRASTTITYKLTYNVGQQIMYSSTADNSFGITTSVTGDVYDAIRAEVRTDTNERSKGELSLFNALPSDIYAIRVYADVLSDEEKAINRMVDLLYYYGVDVPAYFFENENALSSVAYMANDVTIVADAAKSKATKDSLQDALTTKAASSTALDGYAATEDLVAFFTTAVKPSVDLTAGTWTDIIGGSVATLEGKTNWALRENGAIGFDAWGGYMTKGTYTNGKTGFAGDTTAYIGNKYRLLFDINMLPDEDFTVEYLAAYRPILIADADKTASGGAVVYYQENGKDVAAYDYAVSQGVVVNTPGTYIYDAAGGLVNDIFGFFSAFTRIMDGHAGWGTTPRGSMFWAVGMSSHQNPTYQQFLGGGWAPVGDTRFTKGGEAYHVTGGETFNTYGASVDETIVGEHTEALFTIYRDASKYADNSANINSTANNAAADVASYPEDIYYYRKGSDGVNYYQVNSVWYNCKTGEVKPDDVTIVSTSNIAEEWGTAYYDCDYTELKGLWGNVRSGFWLSAGTPTDFLNVRVYNRALTQAEKNQNRLADIKAYYGLELDAEVLEDEELVNQILYKLANFSDTGLVTDASKKQAGKDKMEAIIDPFVAQIEFERANDFASLYVKEGENATLVGLFSAIDGNFTADVTTGVWKNLVAGGANATIRDTGSVKYWEKRDKGIGYDFHYSIAVYQSKAGSGDMNYVSPNNDYDEVGIKLSDSYENYDNFTVESFAMMVGATDDEGLRWRRTGQRYSTISNFRFGLIGTCCFQGLMHTVDAGTGEILKYYYNDGTHTFSGYSDSSLSLRWMTHNVATAFVANMYFSDSYILRVSEQSEGNHLIPVASVMQVEKVTDIVKTAEDTVDKDASSVTYTVNYNNVNKAGSKQHSLTTYESLMTSTKPSTSGVNKVGRFTLFNDLASTVYAIRVYDGILTAAEKSQNRLADLMYYHGIAIPEGLAENASALATIANVANTIKIASSADKVYANKTAIEAAIANALPTVTITAGDETVLTELVAGASYTLPSVIDGKAAVAYTINGEAMLPGTAITLEGDVAAEAILVDAPKTQTKAGLRLASEVSGMGMRFLADLSMDDFNTIKALYGIENITVGMLITPVKYVEFANGVFTREALDAMVIERNGKSAGYVEVLAQGFYASDDTTATIAGSIYNFSASTKAKNPAFTAVAFIDIVVDDVTYTVYGSYDPAVAVRVTDLAINTRPFVTSEQKGWIDALLSQFQ